MKTGILTFVILMLLAASLFAQCPPGGCYVGQPVMSSPVYQQPAPQYIGQMHYIPRPAHRIYYPTPLRDWLFGRYRGGGYTPLFVPHTQPTPATNAIYR